MDWSWEAVTALAAITGLVSAGFGIYVRYVVKTEIGKLNGTYLRTGVAMAKFEEYDRRLDRIEDEL